MRGLPLRVKVFFLFAGAALAIVVPALLLIARAVERGVYENARRDLEGAGYVLQASWAERDQHLSDRARVRALDTAVVRPWADGRTRRLLRALQQENEGEVAVAIDSTGTRITGPELSDETVARAGEPTVVAFPAGGGAPLRVALQPVFTDSTYLGVVGVAAEVSAEGLKRLYLAPGSDLALMVGDSLVGYTLPDTVVRQLDRGELRLLQRSGDRTGRPISAGQAYMAAAYAVPSRGLQTTVFVFRPITQELQVVTAIKRSVLGIGGASLLLSLVLAALVARIVARPAQALAVASARMARGDFAAPLPREGADEIGQLARAFGEMRSAIQDREARLRSAQAEMIHREKLAAMGRLVAQLSHEINNPIYNIQNCLEALERRGNPNDPNREFLELAQEELSRMASLTRRLLDQSRPQSDASALLDLNAVVERVLTLAAGELRSRGIQVEATLARGIPRVVAHPEAIQQVLANLVANASDAMPDGGTLRVATRAHGDAVEAVVEDTGTGIAERDLPHIFEAFYTTKPGVTGIGLGLFVSEGIIRGHRGRIDVESVPGQGSRFTVRLPRETLGDTVAEAPVAEAEPAAA